MSIMVEMRQGSQPLWISGKTLKMSFQFSSQGKLREFGKNTKSQGNCDSDPEGKGFRQFGIYMCVLCHVSKLCSLTDWLEWLL